MDASLLPREDSRLSDARVFHRLSRNVMSGIPMTNTFQPGLVTSGGTPSAVDAGAATHDAGLDTFRHTGLGALLAAAQDCPDQVIIRDDLGPVTAADLARRVRRLAAYFGALGLVLGERVLILGGAETHVIVALIAALHAGLEPALAGCGLGPVEIAAHVRAADAVALIGPTHYGSLRLGDTYLSAAALSETLRLIATFGGELVDGATDIGAKTLDAMADKAPGAASETNAIHDPGLIGTFEGAPTSPTFVRHRQAVLLADALSLVEQARINPSKRIVSTVPPVTLAGLVAGPFAAFIGASSLVLHGPFEAKQFLAACDAEPGFHLVAPQALAQVFETQALAADLGSLIVVSRFVDAQAFEPPPQIGCDRPVVDLYAFGEDNVVAQRREAGIARPPTQIGDRSAWGGLGERLNRARVELG